jgi:hypothetical protein
VVQNSISSCTLVLLSNYKQAEGADAKQAAAQLFRSQAGQPSQSSGCIDFCKCMID